MTNDVPDLDISAWPVTDADLAALHARLEQRAEDEGALDVAYRTVDSPVGTLLLRRAAAAMTGAVAAELALMAYRNGGRVAFLLVGGSALVMVPLVPRLSPFVLMFGSLALAVLGGLLF